MRSEDHFCGALPLATPPRQTYLAPAMVKSSARSVIRLKGVRHNNLKNFDLDLPLNRFVVITGLSGSGKSSLAFDTLFAEGQRRYIETFSPYARQFFDRMDKPQVDSIEGIPPAIAIEQRNAVRTTRSTVGTMTEICDYMKMLWPHVAQLHCRQCGRLVRKDSPQQIWQVLRGEAGPDRRKSEVRTSKSEVLITFDLPLSEKLSLDESLALVAKQGYQRLLLDGQILRLEDIPSRFTFHVSRSTSLTVIQDRLALTEANRARFVEACEQAYHFGKGKLASMNSSPTTGTTGLAHPRNRIVSPQSPALRSLRHRIPRTHAGPVQLQSSGRRLPDLPRVRPHHQHRLRPRAARPLPHAGARRREAVADRPGRGMPGGLAPHLPAVRRAHRRPVQQAGRRSGRTSSSKGDPDYGKDKAHEWPRAWYGVKGYFRWLESKAYKMHVRVLLSRYRAYTPCPDCRGKRLQPEALLYRCAGGKSEGRRPKAEGRSKAEVRTVKRDRRRLLRPGMVRLRWPISTNCPSGMPCHLSKRLPTGTGCGQTIPSAWS